MSSSKAPKSQVKLVTHRNYDNGFELLLEVFFAMITKLVGFGTKAQDLVIYVLVSGTRWLVQIMML